MTFQTGQKKGTEGVFEITNNLAQVLRNDKMCIFIEEYDLDPVLKYYSLDSSFKILSCEFLHMKWKYIF